jgi:hypothetical protein
MHSRAPPRRNGSAGLDRHHLGLARDRELFRRRVGREHRMIFRLHEQELEAVDLVARKDLERAIRELTRG